MSAFDDPSQMPAHLRPASLGGTGQRPVWAFPLDSIPDNLLFTFTRHSHGVFGPARQMPLRAFQNALEETRGDWVISHG